MNDRIHQVGRFMQDVLQEPARQKLSDHGDEMLRRGFTQAAGISLRLVQEKLDALKEQMTGPGLSKVEQAIYANLDELKSELEAGFDRYWQGSDVNWRARKRVAKGVVRETGESQL